MELDDLRRQWQQPELAAPALTPAGLKALAAQQRGGLVDKMRRNARLEAVLNVALALGVVAVLPHLHQLLHRVLAGALLVLAAGLCYYYYRVLAVLRLLSETAGSVRGHLVQLCAGLRQLLRFYYRLTLATVPTTMLFIYGFLIGQLLANPSKHPWQLMLTTAAVLLVLGGIMQVAVVYTTRWYLKRLYGQHLDRLEGQLRELDEAGPASQP